MTRFFDFTDAFYRPLWIRLTIVGVCFGWGLVELSGGFVGWAAIFFALGAFAGWRFATIDYSDGPED